MKKIIFCIGILLIVFSSNAQTLKVLSGLSVSKTEWSDAYYYNYNYPLVGISTGFEVSYLKLKYFRVNTRINYIERGGTYKSDNYPYISRYYFNYASINTTFAFKVDTKIVNPYIYAGPRFDYLLSCNSYTTDTWGNFNRTNYGFDVGAGIEKPISDKFILGLDVVYNFEEKDILNKDPYKVTSKYAGAVYLSFGLKL